MSVDSKPVKRFGILTSGGDSPGMNAAIRAVVRAGIYHGYEVCGVRYGYLGLYEGMPKDDPNKYIFPMTAGSVGDIVHRGGTILHSARLPAFKDHKEIRDRVYENCVRAGLDALVVLGGDGSFAGMERLNKDYGLRVIGLPCTIDNDLAYTDFSIGFDTAVNTAVNCINELRDTMSSHDRISVVEVMGRHCGDLAIYAGAAAGAEAILIPEMEYSDEKWMKIIIDKIDKSRKRNKRYGIIVVAEGVTRFSPEKSNIAAEIQAIANGIDAESSPLALKEALSGLAAKHRDEFTPDTIAKRIEEHYKDQTERDENGIVISAVDARGTVLGHIQRGGSPTATDRMIASRLGLHAIDRLTKGADAEVVGIVENQLLHLDVGVALKKVRQPNYEMIRLADILAM